MTVAFLYDEGNADGTLGGAELTMREFQAKAPIEAFVHDPSDAERVVIGNCVTYSPDIIGSLGGKKVYRYHNDLARHEPEELRKWLRFNATHIFTSPMHRDRYADMQGPVIPPALDLDKYKPNRQTKRHREGACSIGAWQNPGKGQQALREWSERANTPLDIYGTGAHIPTGPTLEYKGPLDPGDVAQTLWRYETFVFLPTEPEPFGRTVVEAWFAGCETITNKRVGARHFLEKDQDALRTAAADFWKLVLS